MLSLVPLSLCLFLSLANAASGQGEISLWSDNGCGDGSTTNFGEIDPVGLNYTLDADVCGTTAAAVHSYQVYRRPTCANGITAAFAFYHGAGCKSEGFGPALNSVNPSTRVDGECLALVEFNSLAFLCDGLGQTNSGGSSASSSPSSQSVASSRTSSASATPIVPSASMTSPLYTAPAGSTIPGQAPVNTASGGIAPSRTLPATSSTAVFTGAASKFSGGSVAGIAAVLGGAIFL